MDYRFGRTSATQGHVRAPDPMTIGVSSPKSVRLICFLCKDVNGWNHTSTNASNPSELRIKRALARVVMSAECCTFNPLNSHMLIP